MAFSTESKLQEVLDSIQGLLVQQTFVYPASGELVQIKKKKAPRAQEGIDQTPGIYIYRSDTPETYKAMAFGGCSSITWLIYIVMVMPGDQDLGDGDVPYYDVWRDQIISLFKPPNIPTHPPLLKGVEGCWDLDIIPDVWLPRQQMNLNYDYLGMGVEVSVTKTN